MTQQKVLFKKTIALLLQHIASGLRDMNKNRLSSFETALLWIKIMEDFLDDDIMFNWVQVTEVITQLLYGNPKFL